jgi:putative spermidine/putrescine transport system substrate-binding protein
MVRKILLVVLVLALAGGLALYWFTRPLPVLTVVTWPGEYGRAQAAAQMRPFGSDKRIDVRIAQYDGGLDDIRRAVKTGQYHGDVVDMELPDAVAACREGLLEPIDAATLPPGEDGSAAAKDFVPGAIGPCWVGSVVYSQIVTFPRNRFADTPTTTDAFFDLAHYPGVRVLRPDSAKFNLEFALLADGVPPGDVYPTLDTPQGQDRAFAKLQSLRGNLLWLNGPQALDAVKDGRAAFATVRNGELFDANEKGYGLRAIWDRQLYEMDVLAIPKGDPVKDRALDYVRYATGSKPLAAMGSWQPYGPARLSAVALVGPNPETKKAMKIHLPTANFKRAFAIDEAWWAAHGAALAPRWQRFVAGN